MEKISQEDMWIFYEDDLGREHTQHWCDLQEDGPLKNLDGTIMILIGWGT